MADQNKNGWKIFGISSIIVLAAAALALGAFFVGRGCEEEDEGDTTTRTQTVPAEPVEEAAPETDGDGSTTTETAPGTTSTDRYVTGEGHGVSPCVGGFMTETTTIYWSDGSTDTTTTTVPCTP